MRVQFRYGTNSRSSRRVRECTRAMRVSWRSRQTIEFVTSRIKKLARRRLVRMPTKFVIRLAFAVQRTAATT